MKNKLSKGATVKPDSLYYFENMYLFLYKYGGLCMQEYDNYYISCTVPYSSLKGPCLLSPWWYQLNGITVLFAYICTVENCILWSRDSSRMHWKLIFPFLFSAKFSIVIKLTQLYSFLHVHIWYSDWYVQI